MRQLKTFMRNRKAEMLGCGPCVCRTMQCWRYASENCGCGENSTEDMIGYIMNWFKNTSVFNDLTPVEKEQALADAQTILEGAGDDITPFYNAVRQGRTFANYVERLGLTVDESGPCDSSVYEDEETFILYISTAGAIHCKYLALVARRGRTPTKELINKNEISDYLDWVTTDTVTYQFKDWDGEILKFGSVNKGQTPEVPSEEPTREGFIFTGWLPAVGPIDIDTTYVAQYKNGRIEPESFSNLSQNHVYLAPGQSTDVTVDYLPVDANDFSGISFQETTYGYPFWTAEIISFNNGTATIRVTCTEYVGSGGLIDMFLNGQYTGIRITIDSLEPSVTSITSFSQTEDINMMVHYGQEVTFTYLPADATDLDNIYLAEPPIGSYDGTINYVIARTGDGTGKITINGVSEGDWAKDVYISGVQTQYTLSGNVEPEPAPSYSGGDD